MKKKTIVAYAAIPVLGLGLYLGGTSGAQAFMGGMTRMAPEELAAHQQSMFERHAELLGVRLEEVKQAWAEGKSIYELAEEKGVDREALKEKMRALQLQELKSRLESLVGAGVITEAQAENRLEFMNSFAERMHGEKGTEKGARGGHRGFGGALGRGR